jgi:hypothetical protein
MVKVRFLSGVLLLSFTSIIQAQQSAIIYELTDLGSNSWQYDYTVSNNTLATPIEEFTIYFNEGLYQNLVVIEPTPDSWNAIVWQPEAGLGDGAYDALKTGLGIAMGETVGGFSVKFDWLGAGQPGIQFYEIVNPSDFTKIDSGFTIPEPAGISLIGLGIMLLRKTHNKH